MTWPQKTKLKTDGTWWSHTKPIRIMFRGVWVSSHTYFYTDFEAIYKGVGKQQVHIHCLICLILIFITGKLNSPSNYFSIASIAGLWGIGGLFIICTVSAKHNGGLNVRTETEILRMAFRLHHCCISKFGACEQEQLHGAYYTRDMVWMYHGCYHGTNIKQHQ